MGLFNQTETYVGAVSVPLIEQQPDILKESLIKAIFKNENVNEAVLDHAMNSTNYKFNDVFKYAQTEYYAGVPTTSYERVHPIDEQIIAYLNSIETDTVSLYDIALESDDPYLHLLDYLTNIEDYDFNTGFIGEIDPVTTGLMDAAKTAFTTTLESPDTVVFDNLRSQLPVASVSEVDVVIDGKSFTEITEVIVDTVENVSASVLDNRTRRLGAIEKDAVGDGFEYVINIDSDQALKGTVISTIEYVYTVRITYRDLAGNITTGSTTVNDVVLLKDVRTITGGSSYPSVVNYFPTAAITDQLYYLIRYSTIDLNQVKTPKALLYPAGRLAPAAFPTYTTSPDSNYFPVVQIRKDNVDLFTPDKVDTPAYRTSKEMLDKIHLSIEDISTAVHESPDINEIDHAFLMFGVNILTENKACLRYLCEFFKHAQDISISVLIDDEVFNKAETTKINRADRATTRVVSTLRFTEGNLDMALSWDSISVKNVQGTIGVQGHVEKELTTIDDYSRVVFKHQIDSNTYEVITIINLRHTNKVYQDKVVTTRIKDLVDPEDPANEYNLIIPLNYDLYSELPVFVKEELYYDAVHLVFYSIQTVKLKWYQTDAFRVLVSIVAIVIFLTTGDFSTAKSIIALIKAGQYGAALIAILTIIGNTLLIGAITKYTVKLLGSELAFVAAIIITIAALYGYIDSSALKEGWAEVLLQASTGLTQAITASIQQDLADLTNEYALFATEADKLNDELDRIADLLEVDSLLDPTHFIHVDPLIDLNESPTDYYLRTVGTTNVADLSYKAIENYIDIKLLLPTPEHI